MKTCKKCKEIISLDLVDIIKGSKAPRAVSKESIKKGLCKDCYNKRS